MRLTSEELKRQIRKAVRIYILGCCLFVLVALASIGFGYYVVRYHNIHELPVQLVVVSLAGGLLLWEMIKAFRFNASLPSSFKPISEGDFPALFAIIREITDALELSPVRTVYLSPDATAAVFIQPQLRNILFEPRKDLVIGLGFLTQMDDDEIRAMLYHEFGHFAQSEMKSSMSVYTVGQFSRSFVSIKDPVATDDTWKLQAKLQVLFFTYFAIWSCNRINRLYSKLSKQMEYDADDVAVKYVGSDTLQRALLHAACIRYNYEAVQWGLQQLQEQNIGVEDEYLALSFVGKYSRPERRLLSEDIIRRVGRLGKLTGKNNRSAYTVRDNAARIYIQERNTLDTSCSALQFAQWLKGGLSIYAQQRLQESSVRLEIHLASKRHKFPLVDSTYKILLDEKPIGNGNFIKGYTLKRKASPGKHTVSVWAPTGIISTTFEFEVYQDKRYRIEMDYILHKKDGIYDVFAEKIEEL